MIEYLRLSSASLQAAIVFFPLSFYLHCSIVIIIITIIVIVGFHCKREQKIKRRKRKQSKAALDEKML